MERLRAEDFAADAPTPALHVVTGRQFVLVSVQRLTNNY